MSRRDFGLGGLRGELVVFLLLGDVALPSILITEVEMEWKISIDIHTTGWERIGGVDGLITAQVDITSKRLFG
jgi:hypothetical protein